MNTGGVVFTSTDLALHTFSILPERVPFFLWSPKTVRKTVTEYIVLLKKSARSSQRRLFSRNFFLLFFQLHLFPKSSYKSVERKPRRSDLGYGCLCPTLDRHRLAQNALLALARSELWWAMKVKNASHIHEVHEASVQIGEIFLFHPLFDVELF